MSPTSNELDAPKNESEEGEKETQVLGSTVLPEEARAWLILYTVSRTKVARQRVFLQVCIILHLATNTYFKQS